MPNVLKFKASATECELEGMCTNGLISSTSTAHCKICVRQFYGYPERMPFAKFGHHFYNWKCKKDFAAEIERTGGMGPPEQDPLTNDSEIPQPVVLPPNPSVARIVPHVIVSPSAMVRTNGSVASLRATEQNSSPFGMTGIIYSTDRMSLPFMPPTIVTGLKNQFGQRIIEADVWLPSGIEFENLSLTVADDMKHLKVHVLMDPILTDGWALHSNLVPRGHELSHTERNMHVHVHHWNTVIDEMNEDRRRTIAQICG